MNSDCLHHLLEELFYQIISTCTFPQIAKLSCCIKARTFFQPRFRFHQRMVIYCPGQVAMPADVASGMIHEQRLEQDEHRMLLPLRACIFRYPTMIEPSFITYRNALQIMPPGMSARLSDGTCAFYLPIFPDIIMVSNSVQSTLPVRLLQFFFSKRIIFLRSGTMNDYQMNSSHSC